MPTTVLAGLRFFHTHGAVLAVHVFCGVGNLVAELYYLRSCSRIFVLTTPDHEPPYCDNSAARNWPYWPKTRTMVYELLPTAWTIGFCSTVFMFGGIQRAIAGRRWHYMCSGATCAPWAGREGTHEAWPSVVARAEEIDRTCGRPHTFECIER